MTKNLNLQYLLSYFGLIPYFFIIIDKYFFFQIKEEIIKDFLIYYTLLILVFIGSINWNLKNRIKSYKAIYGFVPSLLATIIISLNLYNYNYYNIILLLIFALTIQLVLDNFLVYDEKSGKRPFYFIRFPLTLIIIIILLFMISSYR